MALQGLWLILGDNVADVSGFNNSLEAWLLCGTDIFYAVGAAVIIGLAYFGNVPGIDSPVYKEYLDKRQIGMEIMESQPPMENNNGYFLGNGVLTSSKMA